MRKYLSKSWQYMMLGLVAISIGLVISGCGSEEKTADTAPLVKTMVVGKDMAGQENSLAGTIKNRYETALSFQIGGRVIQKNFTVGDTVSAGQVLAVLSQSDTSSQLQNAQGALAAAQSQYDLAATNVERYRILYAQEAISQLQLDQMENNFKVAAAQLSQAQANVQASTNQQEYTQLVAPADGVITASAIEVGQVVGAGQTVGSIAVGNEPEAVIALPEQMLASISVGTPAKVSFWALPNDTVAGVVREISPVPDPTARTYTVKISLTNPPSALKLGMTSQVVFDQAGNAGLTVPLTALVNKAGTEQNNSKAITNDTTSNGKATNGNLSNQAGTSTGQVYVVKDGTVHLVTVQLGALGNNSVVVVSGLSKGDRVVTAGVDKLEEGAKVRI
ncbi:efflux RND transporter periplasmic adaptor subunit [uncultured Veillonella sp.]|uniref:efflux RND transporter periplasmic adaptor subunit n=1 Tax=uncultured Veillonella sp. TaxID=159268 RepID=UPI002631C82F|nr:efflux RND transporter periplasmic adaptor subunit [uncultured Veillonella sp.]